jgi:hypothetical protein
MVCFNYPLLGGRHHIETSKGMVAYPTMDLNVSVEASKKILAWASLTVCVTTHMLFILSRFSGGLLVLLNIYSSHWCFLLPRMKTFMTSSVCSGFGVGLLLLC